MKLEVGMIVYLEPINNMARFGSKEIKECTITKVGRKYFEVTENKNKYASTTRFHIEGLAQVTNYSPDWELYFSEQEILDRIEHMALTEEVRSKIGQYGKTILTLDQLRQIKEIICKK